MGGALARRFERAERVGEAVNSSFWAANRAEKKNREGDGASDFDGSCWMGGRNNQPKSGRIVGIYLGETARRAMAIGEDAIKSFWPSDLGQRNKKSEIRRGFRRPPIDNCTQQPTKFTQDRWGRDRKGRAAVGERRGGGILSLRGRSMWEGGENKMI